MKYVIENKDRPGYYWDNRTGSFHSFLSGEWKRYLTPGLAERVARRISSKGVYRVSVEVDPIDANKTRVGGNWE